MIDASEYQELAALADRASVPFDAVLERYEKGERDTESLIGRRLPSKDWLTTESAGAIVPTHVLTSSRGLIRSRSRSLSSSSCRGVGALWSRSDLERAAAVRALGVSWPAAMKIAAAIRDGKIT